MTKPTIKRRIVLINKPFQLRFALYMVSWLIAISFIYPLMIANVFDYLFQILALDPRGPELSKLSATREELLTELLIIQGSLIAIAFFISIFMSHKIAGPLYKLKLFLARVSKGDLSQNLYFRKADHFQDIPPVFNIMLDALRNAQTEKELIIQSAHSMIAEIAASQEGEFKGRLNLVLSALTPLLPPQPEPIRQSESA